ncbi:TatD family hydrolase [Phaeodactylibacter luteus]|uniref:TatD family deoxyribonuclease n=1 Tax=Phaeodactylibacter luteus TaxID=1564516 RepID=A0A5C6RLS1_9BACT|nr:TatD family hydrolase [Phaeodactylibacter luteus]TXB63308.1 TatD family deoxyribonuclease [Phaeodactylibacter luteus]
MRLIDTHAHLYAGKFDADRAEMMQRALDNGIDRFFLPNIDRASIAGMLQLEESYPGQCFAMMGLHPCSVQEGYLEELAEVEHWLSSRPFCAVGEIGLDLYWDKSFFRQQQDAFRQQIRWAKALDIPIVIHSRDATEEVLAILEEEQDSRLRGIFHCFTGSLEEANRIIALGFLLGIGGVVTFKNGGLDKVVAQLPLSSLVLETDAPYLSPAPYRGKRNESAYIRIIAEKVAEVLGVSLEAVARATTENAETIFNTERLPEGAVLPGIKS